MKKIRVIAIFDVGKTNKKLLLFDEEYTLVHELSEQLAEITDEDGFVCEDIQALTKWVKDSFDAIVKDDRFNVKGVNFSGYGASFVYVDKTGKVIAPLYNYLKPYPKKLQDKFYTTYGGESLFAKQTASPVLGNLNSGMQLYRIKKEQPELFKKIAFAFHLPQYLSYLLSGKATTDITGIGCHTNLWDFDKNKYHAWVSEEGIEKCFAPIVSCTTFTPFVYKDKNYISGIGLHDSSAALIPYLSSFHEPFILLSTGTWSISLNPFNHKPLTDYELHQDCLCYLTYKGERVKASRLFAGHEHEQQVKKLSEHFNTPMDYYKTVNYQPSFIKKLKPFKKEVYADATTMVSESNFSKRTLDNFKTYEEAYHQFILDILQQQIKSTKLVLQDTPVKRIFVDGGFSKNVIFMNLLAEAFADIEIFSAAVPQASALGAALVIHNYWNSKPLPTNVIALKLYSFTKDVHL